MGRLTKRDDERQGIWVETQYLEEFDPCVVEDSLYWLAISKLAHYEDMEEQGRLIEQKQGEWKPLLYDSLCSVCGYSETTPLMIMRRDFKYCPNCGAKMELKELEGE